MYQLIIKDSENDHLSFDLIEILINIENDEIINIDWYLLDFDFKLKQQSSYNFLEIINDISKSEFGLKINWNRLFDLAAWIFQTYDITLLGIVDKPISKDGYWQNKISNYKIAIEAIDSSFWMVKTIDTVLIQKLQNKFTDTELSVLTD